MCHDGRFWTLFFNRLHQATSGHVTISDVQVMLLGNLLGVAQPREHEGNGQWSITLTATEMDADQVGLAITHSTALPLYKTFKTV